MAFRSHRGRTVYGFLAHKQLPVVSFEIHGTSGISNASQAAAAKPVTYAAGPAAGVVKPLKPNAAAIKAARIRRRRPRP